jgi:hypothetical protein
MFHVEHARRRQLDEILQGELSGGMRDDVLRGTLLIYISRIKDFHTALTQSPLWQPLFKTVHSFSTGMQPSAQPAALPCTGIAR